MGSLAQVTFLNCVIKKTDISFLCICLLIDEKLCHNIASGSAVNFDNVMTKFFTNKRIDA